MATGRPVAKTLIKYKNNNLEEIMKKRRNQLILSLLNKKKDPYNDENDIDFNWSDVKEEDIALTSFIESLQSKLMRKFSKKVTKWLLSYLMKRKIKKIFFKVISNTKIFI